MQMMLPVLFLTAIFQLTGSADPVETALRASEAPKSVRIAFTVELRSESAVRVFAFDPRLDRESQWQILSAEGEDGYLDEISATWGAEPAPDGRLFPDDLRASLGTDVQVEDLGAAWRLRFTHTPSANDGAFDVWAAQQLAASAWISPESGRFLRIDYTLPAPVSGPEGGQLLSYDQSYFLETDPEYDLSLITSYKLEFVARGALQRRRQTYTMRVQNAEIFFATPADEARFIAANQQREADVGPVPR